MCGSGGRMSLPVVDDPGWLAERGEQFWVCLVQYGTSAHEAARGLWDLRWLRRAASYHFLEPC
jgi:hypothetical protein